MVDNYARAYRWRDIILGKTTKPNYSSRNTNFYGDDDCLYSYGSHFPMVTVQRDKSGNPVELLRNGDQFSNTTSRHQSVERSVTDAMGLPVVTIPYSVLDEAGIIRSSVRIVEVTSDRWETINVVKHEFPEGAAWRNDEVIDEYGTWGMWDANGAEWQDHFRRPSWLMPREGLQRRLLNTLHEQDAIRRGRWVGYNGRTSHTERNLYVSSRSWDKWHVSIADDGATTYSRSYMRHWLGASLVTANVRYTKLCPKCHGARRRNFEDPRWAGDRWANPWWCFECRGSGGEPKIRKAYFLSAFDENETRPSYFFAELAPGARPKTVAEALESLKPEAVKVAEELGREVKRQGDIFAIPVELDTRTLKKQGANFARKGHLFNTNHAATETATLPDGTTFVRGTLRHVPEFRRPDHKMVSVGKGWHLCVKNTVPVAR